MEEEKTDQQPINPIDALLEHFKGQIPKEDFNIFSTHLTELSREVRKIKYKLYMVMEILNYFIQILKLQGKTYFKASQLEQEQEMTFKNVCQSYLIGDNYLFKKFESISNGRNSVRMAYKRSLKNSEHSVFDDIEPELVNLYSKSIEQNPSGRGGHSNNNSNNNRNNNSNNNRNNNSVSEPSKDSSNKKSSNKKLKKKQSKSLKKSGKKSEKKIKKKSHSSTPKSNNNNNNVCIY